ncbi:hypothetical protein CROQUDRAFT_670845 [Cronartium quercuum f. sp. fusiforme G11]|uniref:Velvet domain-containing protein n=1 Tax=Cronartium quercuum f. sp. fusiforme G11 TaxID=708437 RepID=A0A9P6TCR0_9BASI|nr:hypothetical protein CROQUDRAFT_670845 [Cronartium quercuum f. sp. fusiforme G11]
MSQSRSLDSDHLPRDASNRVVSPHPPTLDSSIATSSTSFKFTSGQFAQRQLIFRAQVVQQPERCRMSGFGEKDRRPIDPPPVVKFSLVDPQGGIVAPETIEVHTLLCHVSLYSADRREPRGLVLNPSASASDQSSPTLLTPPDSDLEACPVRNLLGSLTTQARLLRNEVGELGLYFIFSDLAVRTEGIWTCRFSITDINSSDREREGDMPELVATFSEPFHVSPAKSFKGMLDSTPLTKAFSKQGVKLILRNVGCSNSDEGQSP